jgi:hypothetical protein
MRQKVARSSTEISLIVYIRAWQESRFRVLTMGSGKNLCYCPGVRGLSGDSGHRKICNLLVFDAFRCRCPIFGTSLLLRLRCERQNLTQGAFSDPCSLIPAPCLPTISPFCRTIEIGQSQDHTAEPSPSDECRPRQHFSPYGMEMEFQPQNQIVTPLFRGF